MRRHGWRRGGLHAPCLDCPGEALATELGEDEPRLRWRSSFRTRRRTRPVKTVGDSHLPARRPTGRSSGAGRGVVDQQPVPVVHDRRPGSVQPIPEIGAEDARGRTGATLARRLRTGHGGRHKVVTAGRSATCGAHLRPSGRRRWTSTGPPVSSCPATPGRRMLPHRGWPSCRPSPDGHGLDGA